MTTPLAVTARWIWDEDASELVLQTFSGNPTGMTPPDGERVTQATPHVIEARFPASGVTQVQTPLALTVDQDGVYRLYAQQDDGSWDEGHEVDAAFGGNELSWP